MLNICCLNAGNYLERGAEYVNILADMVGRNISDKICYKFICFTDTPGHYSADVDVRPLPVGGLTGWWNKLALFKDGVFPNGSRVLFLDLDTVIVGGLDDIIKYDGAFGALRDFCYPSVVQSAIMAWCAGERGYIWDEYEKAGRPILADGDQEWIQSHVENPDLWQAMFPLQILSYKENCQGGFPVGAKIVCFHGYPRPHQVVDSWVPKVWKIGGGTALELELIGNVESQHLIDNIKHAITLPCELLTNVPEHDGHAVIVGGSPSLMDNLDEVKMRKEHGQTIFALNGAYKYLMDNGIQPDYHVMLDARPENGVFVPENTKCFYASQVDASVLDTALERNNIVTVWHCYADGIQEITASDPRATSFVGGGSSVGLRTMCLAYILGFRELHLYGMDSSYNGLANHAYPQALNDGEKVIEVECSEQVYKVAPWMAVQVNQFKELAPALVSMGCTITLRGVGLLPDVFAMMTESIAAADLRANAILQRIVGIEKPIGAEIGVFAADLSRRLLRCHPGLTLLMVDSWATSEKSTAYSGTDDFHASLTQEKQNGYYEHTIQMVDFAGSRARIMRQASVSAALQVEDGTLDFVFIDADHSYEGASQDILAWLPKVKKGGWLCGHDYENTNFPKFGVRKAVDEFVTNSGRTLELGDNFTWFTQII